MLSSLQSGVPSSTARSASHQGQAARAGGAVRDPHATEARVIGGMQTAGLLMPFVFMGHMLSKGLGWALGGAVGLFDKQAGKNTKSWIVSFHETLHVTPINNLKTFGANFRTIRSHVAANGKLDSELVSDLFAASSKPAAEVSGRLGGFIGKLEGGSGALGDVGKRVGKFLKNLPGKVRGASLFNALAVGGAIASTGAMWLMNHRASREDNEALKDFAADVYGVPVGAVTNDMLKGPNVHPMVAEARKIYDKNTHGRTLMNVFGVAGDALMVNNMGAGFSMPLMMAEMALPQLGQMLSQENPTLSVYEMLKKSEKGEFELAPKQKVQAVAYLLSTVPAIAHNQGVTNTYVAPVANELVERGMNTAQIIHTISNPEKFQQISREVFEKIQKQQAEAAAAAPQAPAPATVAGHTGHAAAHAPKQAHTAIIEQRRPAANMPVMHPGEKPKAAVGSIAHAGTVQQAHGLAVNS